MRARKRSSASANRSPRRRSLPGMRRTTRGSCLPPPEFIPTTQPHSTHRAMFRNCASYLIVRLWRSASAGSTIITTIRHAKPNVPRSRLRLRLLPRCASLLSSTREMRKTTPALSFAMLEPPAFWESCTATQAPIHWRSSPWMRDGTFRSAASSLSRNGRTTT